MRTPFTCTNTLLQLGHTFILLIPHIKFQENNEENCSWCKMFITVIMNSIYFPLSFYLILSLYLLKTIRGYELNSAVVFNELIKLYWGASLKQYTFLIIVYSHCQITWNIYTNYINLYQLKLTFGSSRVYYIPPIYITPH